MVKLDRRWLGVEVRHLAALTAIARTGSFRAAGEALGYTQSAISSQIATLERQVGRRLVVRPGGSRPVALTRAGAALIAHAEVIVARLEAARSELAAMGDSGPPLTLRVGTFQSVSSELLPSMMRSFASAWPDVEVDIVDSPDDGRLLTWLEEGVLDLSFVVFPLPSGPFQAQELFDEPFLLLSAVGSPFARKSRLDRSDIVNLPLIDYSDVREVHRAEARLAALGVPAQVVFRSDQTLTIQALVAEGVGHAILPRSCCEQLHPRVVATPLSLLGPRSVGIAWHRYLSQSSPAQAFAKAAVERARTYSESARARTQTSPAVVG